MKQTIDDLSKYNTEDPNERAFIGWWTQEDQDIFNRVYGKGEIGPMSFDWSSIFQDFRDASFMHALSSKKNLPYTAKLVALRMEGAR